MMERITGNMMIGSPSIDGKMKIKLKIPKFAPLAAMEGQESPAEDVIGNLSSKTVEEEKRVCLECNKEFISGKALGGHMRVHAQVQSANKNPIFLKPVTKFKKTTNNGDCDLKMIKPYYMNSVNDEGKPTCCQCGKTFPSMKSLFGHMRCHPERVWRGILPPPSNTITTFERRRRKIDDQVVDLTKFLRGWPVTERRGRKALKTADDDEVLLEAVEDLMNLAIAGGVASMAEWSVTQRQLKEDEIDGILPEKLELDDVNSANKCANKIKRRKKMKLMMELEQTAGVTVVSSDPTALAPLPEQQQPVTELSKYKCTTCNKCFATHQALGGHRSSHNKSKLTSTDHHQIEEDDHESFLMNQSRENLVKEIEFAGGFPATGKADSNSNSTNSVHQCPICDKVFATGQALGGHKRCHWSEAQSSQITSTGEADSQTGSDRKVHDFDLNEIPPVMMEEVEAANVYGNGYASSSYNSNMG
ncbi:hypothetical protein R6Q57_026027 [Mikania cordata]